MSEKVDKKWMLEALLLAGKGVGKTRPNPPVGAVVVKGNAIIGSGWHRKAGGPHAEVYALKEAGTRARNSTLYVTLEPCSTTGRTLACTQAILDAGIRRIVVAVRDPNPAHAGRGLALLRRRGITVTCGVCKTEAQALIEPFKKWVTTGVPWVTLKMAMSLDGRIADVNGNSKWITGSQARHEVQSMRRRADAILVGAETVRQDNPSLYPRPAQGRKPHRIIVSSDGKIPLKSKVLTDAFAASTIIATSKTCSTTQSAALARKGASVKSFPQKSERCLTTPYFELFRRSGYASRLSRGWGAYRRITRTSWAGR